MLLHRQGHGWHDYTEWGANLHTGPQAVSAKKQPDRRIVHPAVERERLLFRIKMQGWPAPAVSYWAKVQMEACVDGSGCEENRVAMDQHLRLTDEEDTEALHDAAVGLDELDFRILRCGQAQVRQDRGHGVVLPLDHFALGAGAVQLEQDMALLGPEEVGEEGDRCTAEHFGTADVVLGRLLHRLADNPGTGKERAAT